jgi:para-nitrobenzyl esterase
MFAWSKPPMLPTTTAGIDGYFARTAPDARGRVLAAYPDYPRRRARRPSAPTPCSGHPPGRSPTPTALTRPPTHRFDRGLEPALLGLGATGSEIVHIQHSYGSYLGRKMHPLAAGCNRRWAVGCNAPGCGSAPACRWKTGRATTPPGAAPG